MKDGFFNKMAIRAAQTVSKVIGKENFVKVIIFLARTGQIDLLTLVYKKMGLLNSENDMASGEHFVISSVLKKEIKKKDPILFDIGANKGFYAQELLKEFPQANIFAFEPNPKTYAILRERLAPSPVQIFNIGFHSGKTAQKIYSYAHEPDSGHSSIFKEVFTKLHQSENLLEMDFSCTTVDDFCSEHKVYKIDFMKIDTEGNEFHILKGAIGMLKANSIRFIQFEFNEMNIISRVFLRDFYDLLPQYEFYRLSPKKLIPLRGYNPANEIFKFQNILAVNKKL